MMFLCDRFPEECATSMTTEEEENEPQGLPENDKWSTEAIDYGNDQEIPDDNFEIDDEGEGEAGVEDKMEGALEDGEEEDDNDEESGYAEF